ncbi:unnamed protein product, partial [Pylaiella littoralis]
MAHVAVGERVYVKDTDVFGDIARKRVLGVDAVSLVDDEGNTVAYFGAKIDSDIVNKETGLDGSGADVEVPVDVKEEGIEVLSAMNVSAEDQRLMFVKFMGMFDQETRRAYVADWKEKKGDPELRKTFLEGMMNDLDDDEAFIQEQGTRALAGVDEDVRRGMFEALVSTRTKEEREGMILEWMTVKGHPDAREEFLQKMYEILMDDDDYIAMEGKKAFTELRILEEDQAAIFAKFMAVTTVEDRAAYAANYRSARRSRSQKRLFLQKLIDL